MRAASGLALAALVLLAVTCERVSGHRELLQEDTAGTGANPDRTVSLLGISEFHRRKMQT